VLVLRNRKEIRTDKEEELAVMSVFGVCEREKDEKVEKKS